MRSTTTVRTGVRVTAAPSGCPGCGHPRTLHGNGETSCRAVGCKGGPEAACQLCQGSTMTVVGSTCPRCHGTGLVRLACPGFAAGHEHPVPELLAS